MREEVEEGNEQQWDDRGGINGGRHDHHGHPFTGW